MKPRGNRRRMDICVINTQSCRSGARGATGPATKMIFVGRVRLGL
jgi:hypothetical protein